MKHEHLPEGWRWIKLGDVLEQQYRQEKLQEGTDYTTLGVRWYAGGTFIKQERDGDDISSSYLNRVEEGDFIYNRLFAWKGSFAVVPAEHAGYHVSNEFPVFKIKAPDQVDMDYLLWYTKREHFWEYIATLSTGTSNASRLRYKEDYLNRESIPQPPVYEQRRIAEVLRDAEANIAYVESQIEAAKEVKHGATQRLFMYGLAGEGAPTKHTSIGKLPVSWEVVQLSDVVLEAQYGLSDQAGSNGRYAILRMTNLVDGYVDSSDMKYLDIDEGIFKKFQVGRGDILFNRTNSPDLVGKTAIFDLEGQFTFASYIIRLVLDKTRVEPRYLNFHLNTREAQGRLKSLATQGVSQSNINAANLRKFEIPLPKFKEQCEIAAILSAHDEVICTLQAQVTSLREIKRGLMQRLLSGQVRV